ncbi:hypothetical protein BU15DRAFT_71453 [Melanogaster broomeanus]|nr:hypothetical protein BU15DRAFT_71453 [Melanogaster broomeanus]
MQLKKKNAGSLHLRRLDHSKWSTLMAAAAAKTQWGSMDTQDLIVRGMSRPGRVYEEQPRIADLCKWGKAFGVDAFDGNGFVMLCDFTSRSLEWFLSRALPVHHSSTLVNSSPVSHQVHQFPLKPCTLVLGTIVFQGSYGSKLDLAGLVSLYDTQLAPSLVPIRAGQERWDHRVRNISSEDASAARARLEEALTRPNGHSSGIDWRALIRKQFLDLARKTQVQLRIMLTPYILHTATPLHETKLDWAVPIFKLCATTHTSFIQSDSPSMTPSERLILQAIRETSREICRVVTNMWASGVHAGLDSLLNTLEHPDVREVTKLMDAWRDDVNHLMAWLDWSVWVKCKPACGPAEICYLPTWPFDFPWLPMEDPKPEDPDPSPRTMFGAREDFRLGL